MGNNKDLQDELKIHAEFRKKRKESLEKHLEDNGVSQSAKAKIALQESQINLLNTKLSEEQKKIIALENYSRWENLRFMNILEQEHENCTDTVYDIVENDCGHQNGASQLFLVVFLARDFNLVLDVQNDKKGGRLTTHKNSLKEVQNIINSLDLIDIWRVSNLDIRGFTWRRSKPEIHCRLRLFLDE